MLDFGKDLDIMVGNTLGDGLIFGLLYLRDGNDGLLTAIDDFTPDFSENPENDYPYLRELLAHWTKPRCWEGVTSYKEMVSCSLIDGVTDFFFNVPSQKIAEARGDLEESGRTFLYRWDVASWEAQNQAVKCDQIDGKCGMIHSEDISYWLGSMNLWKSWLLSNGKSDKVITVFWKLKR